MVLAISSSRGIFTISPDGNSYKKWNDFISKFYNPWIYQEYSITANHHPTPKVHQYIGESLIKFFKSLIEKFGLAAS